MSPENEELQWHYDTNEEGDTNDTVRPSVKSDKTEETHETGSRDEHAETRDSGREGEEKIGSIDISCANLYINISSLKVK
jgi:hypothetical protein